MKTVFLRALPVLCAALLAGPSTLRAQSVADVAPGSRVRVMDAGAGRIVGTVMELRGDSLLLVSGRGDRARVVAVSVSSLRRLQVSRGRESRPAAALRGAGVGLLGGAAAGAAGATLGHLASRSECDGSADDFVCFSTAEWALFGVLFGAPYGAAWGAAAGFLFPGERWSSVPIRAAPVVSLDARGGGVRLGLSIPLP